MAATSFPRIRGILNRLWMPEPFPQTLEILDNDAEVDLVLVYVRLSCWEGETQWWVVRHQNGAGRTWWVEGRYAGLKDSARRAGPMDLRDLSEDALSALNESLNATDFWNLPRRYKGSGKIDVDSVSVFCADRNRRHRVGGDDTDDSPLSGLLDVLHKTT
jgi:hypothetical protein